MYEACMFDKAVFERQQVWVAFGSEGEELCLDPRWTIQRLGRIVFLED